MPDNSTSNPLNSTTTSGLCTQRIGLAGPPSLNPHMKMPNTYSSSRTSRPALRPSPKHPTAITAENPLVIAISKATRVSPTPTNHVLPRNPLMDLYAFEKTSWSRSFVSS